LRKNAEGECGTMTSEEAPQNLQEL